MDVVEALLGFGADPNARDAEGNTALIHAVRFGNDEAVAVARALEGAGADPDLKNRAGETFWEVAAESGSSERLACLRQLFKR